MDYTAAVNVTVTDQLNRPVANANCTIDGITVTTDTSGKVILNNVPYGTKNLVVTV